MPKDWKDISDDEILNDDVSNTARIARYQRLMEKKNIDALYKLKDTLTQLMESVDQANQNFKMQTGELINTYEKISRNQGRQQLLVIALSCIITFATVAYTWITWESVSTMREANRIQQKFFDLKSQQPYSVPY